MAFIDFDEQLPVLHADEGSHVKCYLWDELTNDTFQMSKLGWRTVQSKQEREREHVGRLSVCGPVRWWDLNDTQESI